MLLSGAWGKVIHEKNLKQKISWHCPFKYCCDVINTDPREYWAIYRGPGLCPVLFAFSPPTPSTVNMLSLFHSLPVCRRSSLMRGRGGGGQIIRRRGRLVIYESFSTLWQTRMSGDIDWIFFFFCCAECVLFTAYVLLRPPPPPIHFTHCYRNRNIQLTLSMFFPFKVITSALTLSFLKLTRLYTSSAGYADLQHGKSSAGIQ